MEGGGCRRRRWRVGEVGKRDGGEGEGRRRNCRCE